MESDCNRVCVTGGSGYIGSWLVKKLLERGYTVHATLRNLDEKAKVGLLNSFPHADTRLVLFQADIYNPSEFEPAIEGCHYVFHLATPFQHNPQSSQYKDTSEAAIAGMKSIVSSCIRSQTVKRLIYTASVLSSSPLKEDGSGYKSSWDESCWTPLNLSYIFCDEYTLAYTKSKTLTQKELLSYNESGISKLEVVSLVCGLVGGDALLSYLPLSLGVAISHLITDKSFFYNGLRFLQELLGSIPLVHIEDVCEAHIFCIEKESLRRRFLCAAVDPTIQEMASYYQQNYPHLIKISEEFMGGPERGSSSDSTKLIKMGFQYKYDMKKILDDSVACGSRLGVLSSTN